MPEVVTVLASATVGSALAAAVTATIADHWWWGQRLGRSRFRRANLPVGGSLAIVGAELIPAGSTALLAAGIAASTTAIGWRWVKPLPPVGVW